MSNMFKNFIDIPTDYSPNNECQLIPDREISKLPIEVYNAKNELIGFTWNYGDSIVLEFITTGTVEYDDTRTYEDASTYLSDKTMTITISNNRYQEVISQDIVADTKVRFIIDDELSKLFLRGTYYCDLKLKDDSGVIQTLFNGGCLYVK